VSVLSNRNAEGASKTEISNLEHVALAIHQQVLGFQIAMNDTPHVALGHTSDQLIHEQLHLMNFLH